jgi:hypothetical protein
MDLNDARTHGLVDSSVGITTSKSAAATAHKYEVAKRSRQNAREMEIPHATLILPSRKCHWNLLPRHKLPVHEEFRVSHLLAGPMFRGKAMKNTPRFEFECLYLFKQTLFQ